MSSNSEEINVKARKPVKGMAKKGWGVCTIRGRRGGLKRKEPGNWRAQSKKFRVDSCLQKKVIHSKKIAEEGTRREFAREGIRRSFGGNEILKKVLLRVT